MFSIRESGVRIHTLHCCFYSLIYKIHYHKYRVPFHLGYSCLVLEYRKKIISWMFISLWAFFSSTLSHSHSSWFSVRLYFSFIGRNSCGSLQIQVLENFSTLGHVCILYMASSKDHIWPDSVHTTAGILTLTQSDSTHHHLHKRPSCCHSQE